MIAFINNIYVMDAHHLYRNVTFIPRTATALCSVYLPWRRLCSRGLSRMEVQERVAKNARIFDIQISSVLNARCEARDDHPVFLLDCTDGNQYLVGTDSRPFPSVTQTTVSSDKVSEGARIKLDIRLTGGEPLYLLIHSM